MNNTQLRRKTEEVHQSVLNTKAKIRLSSSPALKQRLEAALSAKEAVLSKLQSELSALEHPIKGVSGAKGVKGVSGGPEDDFTWKGVSRSGLSAEQKSEIIRVHGRDKYLSMPR